MGGYKSGASPQQTLFLFCCVCFSHTHDFSYAKPSGQYFWWLFCDTSASHCDYTVTGLRGSTCWSLLCYSVKYVVMEEVRREMWSLDKYVNYFPGRQLLNHHNFCAGLAVEKQTLSHTEGDKAFIPQYEFLLETRILWTLFSLRNMHKTLRLRKESASWAVALR